MANFELNAELRSVKGKGASRRLRRLEGLTPAIVYGAGKEPAQVTLQMNVLQKALEDEGFFSHIITLNVGDTAERVLIKDVQRHAFKPVILHVDFLRVNNDTVIKQHVPVHFINEESCVGVKQGGGKAHHIMTDIEVICQAKDLPEFIEVDVAAVEAGQIIHLSDLTMAEGVEILALTHGPDHDTSVFSVEAPKGGSDEEEAEAAAE